MSKRPTIKFHFGGTPIDWASLAEANRKLFGGWLRITTYPQPWSNLCDHATPDGVDIIKADDDNVHWEAQ